MISSSLLGGANLTLRFLNPRLDKKPLLELNPWLCTEVGVLPLGLTYMVPNAYFAALKLFIA